MNDERDRLRRHKVRGYERRWRLKRARGECSCRQDKASPRNATTPLASVSRRTQAIPHRIRRVGTASSSVSAIERRHAKQAPSGRSQGKSIRQCPRRASPISKSPKSAPDTATSHRAARAHQSGGLGPGYRAAATQARHELIAASTPRFGSPE